MTENLTRGGNFKILYANLYTTAATKAKTSCKHRSKDCIVRGCP